MVHLCKFLWNEELSEISQFFCFVYKNSSANTNETTAAPVNPVLELSRKQTDVRVLTLETLDKREKSEVQDIDNHCEHVVELPIQILE